MMNVKNNKGDYFSIPWENQDRSGLGGLSHEKKLKMQRAVNRMNADLFYLRQNGYTAPKIYHEQAKKLCNYWFDSAQMNDVDRKNSEVTIAEENFVLDREKARTYYDTNIAGQIFAPVTRVLNQFKWDVKQYEIQKMENAVKFSRHFDSPRYIQLKLSSQTDKGVGWYVGYQISRWQILENKGELFDIQYETMLEAAAQMGRTAHEHILTGTTIQHGGTDDLGQAGSGLAITGFANHGSLQTFSISTLTTFLNIYKGLKTGLADLKKVFATNNVILITSGGIADQVESNFNTYETIAEKEMIAKNLVGPNNPIKQWWVTDHITGSAISTSTQAALLIKLDPRLLSRLIVLPLQTLPSLDEKTWADNVQEVMLAADILRYNVYDTTENAFPATISASNTTASVGYLSNCRYM